MIARLVLEDGEVFEGKSFGKEGTAIGQVICHTGIVGYEAIVTDPAMRGNIVAMTYPLIGNYGINEEDLESDKGQAIGLVVQEISEVYSSWTSKQCLADFAREQGVVGITGVDTRRLALHIRDHGEQMGIITTLDEDVPELISKIKAMEMEDDPVSKVTTETVRVEEPAGAKTDVGVLDLGVTRSLIRQLLNADARVTVYPASTGYQEILQGNHDGVVVAGGPGSPRQIPYVVDTVKQLFGRVPMFGVELGHLVMAVALGAEVTKLPVGHHGANKAIKWLGEEKRLAMTWQNHSLVVDKDSICGKDIEILAENLNDGTIEVFRFKGLSAFSVQHRPTEYENGASSDEVRMFLALVNR